jgi:hypothetical protein
MRLLSRLAPLLVLSACVTADLPPLPPAGDVKDAFDKRCHDFLDALRRNRFVDATNLLERSDVD